MFRKFIYLFLLVCAVILVGCESQQEFIVVDQREVLGDVFTEQSGLVDNCRGSDVLSQDIAARREFRHSIELHLNQNANLDRQKVEERILTAYDIPDATGEKQCLIPADVPAGKAYQYEIEWTKVLREGNLEEGQTPGQGNILGTYSIVVDLQCQVVGVNVAPCN